MPLLVGADCVLHNVVEEKEGDGSYCREWDNERRRNASQYPEPDLISYEEEFETVDFEDDEDTQAIRNAIKTYLKKFPYKLV